MISNVPYVLLFSLPCCLFFLFLLHSLFFFSFGEASFEIGGRDCEGREREVRNFSFFLPLLVCMAMHSFLLSLSLLFYWGCGSCLQCNFTLFTTLVCKSLSLWSAATSILGKKEWQNIVTLKVLYDARHGCQQVFITATARQNNIPQAGIKESVAYTCTTFSLSLLPFFFFLFTTTWESHISLKLNLNVFTVFYL